MIDGSRFMIDGECVELSRKKGYKMHTKQLIHLFIDLLVVLQRNVFFKILDRMNLSAMHSDDNNRLG